MLRALARYPVVLADGQGQLAKAFVIRASYVLIERIEVLVRALAECLLADDDAALVVLDGRSENFR